MSKPTQIISVKDAKTVYDAYDERVALIKTEEGSGFNPTRYADFSFQEIKDYISYIENETQPTGKTPSTLRFYLSRYPKDSKTYPKQNTLFMLPTINVEGKDEAYYIEDDNGTPKAALVKDTMNNGGQTPPNSKSLVLNNGHLTPPPFEKTDFDK